MTAKRKRRGRQKHVPMRTCVACRGTKPKRALVRIVAGPDQEISIDETGKRRGRGAYLCRQRRCWRTALDRRSLQRALRAPLKAEALARLEAFASSLPEEVQDGDAPVPGAQLTGTDKEE